MFTYTSRDAYNGCLSLYSQHERIHRGDSMTSETIVIDKKKDYEQARILSKLCIQEIPESKLPYLRTETVEDVIRVRSDDKDFASPSIPTLTNDKVIVRPDDISFEDLRLAFPTVNQALLSLVFNQQTSRVGCCAVLSSLASSGVTHLTFTFDPIAFPPLLRRQHRLPLSLSVPSLDSDSCVNVLSVTDSWSLCEESERESVNMSDCEGDEDEWEIISDKELKKDEKICFHQGTKCKRFSYADIVRVNASPTVKNGEEEGYTTVVKPRQEWKPLFVICKITRAPAPPPIENSFPHDDMEFIDGVWTDPVATYYGSKSAARTSRGNTIQANQRVTAQCRTGSWLKKMISKR